MPRLVPAAASLTLALALASGCANGGAVSHYGKVVQGERDTTVNVRVTPGDRFSLAVPDTTAAGEDWTLITPPDPKVSSYISEEHVEEPSGTPGSTYFVLNAKKPGTTDVVVSPCPSCPPATFHITVSDQQS
ncbi:putative secreted protein [Thermocatellispora tengchongensis]|uniref:Putative secreted protein n=1 Tax=Thermocatellispora tengchongensis TaxID=1073253 RepID=A0A840PJP2_9ACTN|nr:protease inhibitor I42 family protein [Thermocatellispora tengchongensis]MBB5138133.1 putative secreted protein [Thermocatellispora tengchongensis]